MAHQSTSLLQARQTRCKFASFHIAAQPTPPHVGPHWHIPTIPSESSLSCTGAPGRQATGQCCGCAAPSGCWPACPGHPSIPPAMPMTRLGICIAGLCLLGWHCCRLVVSCALAASAGMYRRAMYAQQDISPRYFLVPAACRQLSCETLLPCCCARASDLMLLPWHLCCKSQCRLKHTCHLLHLGPVMPTAAVHAGVCICQGGSPLAGCAAPARHLLRGCSCSERSHYHRGFPAHAHPGRCVRRLL